MMPNLSKSEEKLAVIEAAATRVFARYGYARATMNDVAREAGMSRPALYLLYANKEALFRALAANILAAGLAAAEAAWPAGAPAHPGLADALAAKELPLFRLMQSSPHADDILAANGRLLADLHESHAARFTAWLEARLGAAGVADSAGLAAMISHAVHGLKSMNVGEAAFLADIDRLSRLVARS
jgi:AcrR family transcriptional regulator